MSQQQNQLPIAPHHVGPGLGLAARWLGEADRTGLVLEGGALRGLFSAGVMDVMLELGIEVQGVVGVSAGAAFGVNYVSRQSGRALRYNQRFAGDRRYCGLWSLLTTGDYFNAEFAFHTVPREYDLFDNEAFESSPVDYHIVTTDVLTGKPHYRPIKQGGEVLYEWIRASSSMPMVSRIVELDGMKLLDGGISDSIPLRYMESQGYDRNIVVLTQPVGFVKKPNPLMWLARIMLRRYPALLDAMARRHEMYNEELEYVARRARDGAAIVIQPDEPLPISRLSSDPAKMQATYDLGVAAARRAFR